MLLDPFAGVGGNAIQFARTCGAVLASDRDAPRLRLARHNAGVYGVADRIQFRCADFGEAVGAAQVCAKLKLWAARASAAWTTYACPAPHEPVWLYGQCCARCLLAA